MIILSLGSSIFPRESYLKRALKELAENFNILKVSKVYKTQAWGGVAKNEFLNMCVEIECDLNAYELLKVCNSIENKLGRTREQHWADRTIDIDIIFYKELVFNDDKLIIPHKFIKDRNFVLKPLIDICGDIYYEDEKLSYWLNKIEEEIEIVNIEVFENV